MASNFQGLSTTKRHARANGINAGGINAGADGPGVLSMVLMKICLEFFHRKFVRRWIVCTVRRIPSVNV